MKRFATITLERPATREDLVSLRSKLEDDVVHMERVDADKYALYID